MKKLTTILATALITGSLLLQACSSNEEEPGGANDSSCNTVTDQAVQGNFRGNDFVSPAGFYKEYSFSGTTTYRCEIYVKENIEDDCFFPTFEGTQDNILFSIPSLENQTITFSETGDNTLNFNRIDDGVTEIELATCGMVEITNYDETTGVIHGKVIAKGQEGSEVDGNFSLQLCEF